MAKKSGSSQKRKGGKAGKKQTKYVWAIAVLLALIIIAAAVIWFVKPDLYHIYLGVGEHTYGDWREMKAATCTERGKYERECSVCGEKETRETDALGHNWSDWAVTEAATCTDDGFQTRVCSVCDQTETEEILAVGHDWGDWEVTSAATCAVSGSQHHICKVCDTDEEQAIPATGNHSFDEHDVCVTCHQNRADIETAPEISNSDLSIHFLELGNKYTGDCTLIKYGNTEVLIDAGSRQGSATTIKNYVDGYCTDGVLEYVIATHAHQDHIAGFVGNKSGDTRTGILYQYEVGTLIQFSGHNAGTNIYKNYVAATEYAAEHGTTVYTAKQCWYQTDGAKNVYYLDDAQNVSMRILYQRYYDESTSDENDYSVCVLLTQTTQNKTFNYLFTGDLEKDGESSLVDNNVLPEVELFKGGHHGSYTATTEKLLDQIKPKNVAVCCCCGTTEYTDNPANTFPAQDFIDRVAQYTDNVYCTTLTIDYKAGKYAPMNGNIVFFTVGGNLYLECSDNDLKLKDTDWFKENRVCPLPWKDETE